MDGEAKVRSAVSRGKTGALEKEGKRRGASADVEKRPGTSRTNSGRTAPYDAHHYRPTCLAGTQN